MNITLDDTSPQIQYTSPNGTNTWLTNHTSDNLLSDYYDQTFYGTYTEGDAMTLTFNGTAVYIFGAKRDNHGVYSTQLDGGDILFQNGQNVSEQFQAVLFAQDGLDASKEHTVQLVNRPSRSSPAPNATLVYWLDIDYVVLTTPVTGKVYTTKYDDTSTYCSYSNGSAWTLGPPLSPQNYYNTTAHITSTVGANVTCRFSGSSVQLFGGLYSDHGNYSVTLDGGAAQVYNGTYFQLETQVSLFTATNLTDGPHTITMTNLGKGPVGSFLDFDYMLVNTTIFPDNNVNSGASTNTSTVSSSSGTSGTSGGSTKSSAVKAAAIGGGVGGGVAALLLLGLLAWFCIRRRRRQKDEYSEKISSPVDLTGDEVMPYTDSPHTDRAPFSTGVSGSHPGFNSDPRSDPETGNNWTGGAVSHYYDATAASGSDRQPGPETTPFLTHNRNVAPIDSSLVSYSYPHSVNPPSSMHSPDRESARADPYGVGRSRVDARSQPQPQSVYSANTFGHISTAPTAADTTTTSNQAQNLKHELMSNSFALGPSIPRARTSTSTSNTPTSTKSPIALPFTARPPRGSVTTTSNKDSYSYSNNNSPQSPIGSSNMTEMSPISRLRVPGREVDAGPLPLEEDDDEWDGKDGPLPPDYTQATEPLPGQGQRL